MPFSTRFRCLLLAFLSPAVAWAQAPRRAEPLNFKQWVGEMKDFARQDSLQKPPAAPIVFTGSSSVRMWKTLEHDFAGSRVLNRGFGGSRFPDATHYFEQLVRHYKPRQVVLYEGDNDINAGNTVEEVYQGFLAFESRMRRELPGVELVYLAIKPSPSRWALYPRMQQANARIKAYIDRHPQYLRFVDFGPAMLGRNGRPRPELYQADSLHMTPAGYAIWTKQLRPYLKK